MWGKDTFLSNLFEIFRKCLWLILYKLYHLGLWTTAWTSNPTALWWEHLLIERVQDTWSLGTSGVQYIPVACQQNNSLTTKHLVPKSKRPGRWLSSIARVFKYFSHLQASLYTLHHIGPKEKLLPRLPREGEVYWSGLPFPSPGDLPNPGMEPGPPALQEDSLPSEPQGKPFLLWDSHKVGSLKARSVNGL